MKPTVGRVVYYKAYGTPGGEFKPGAERAAIITKVHNDDCVDLCVMNPAGLFFNQSVMRDESGRGGTWDWMPYQKGQAAKTEALEMQLATAQEKAVVSAESGMSFGAAIEALREGKRVARAGWNGKGIFIELQRPDEHSKMTHPYIFIDTTGLQTDNPDAPKNRVPWLASQTDMLSEDWGVVE